MLSQIREKFAGGIALAILAIIGVSFVFFGTNLNFGGNVYAAKVEDTEISINMFQNAYRQQLDANPQIASLPPELRQRFRQNVLDSLVRERLVEIYLNEAGYRVSDAELTDAIQQIPEFQVDGKFDLDTAETVLAQNGYTTTTFRNAQRGRMRLDQLQRAIGGTAIVTPAEFRRYLNLIAEQRLVSLATFDIEAVAADVEVTDEQVAAYYEENDSLYVLPESVDIEYVEVDRTALADRIEISEETLNEYYRESQSRYMQDEQRRARHILIPIGDDEDAAEEMAEDLLQQLQNGASFDELAAEHSVDSSTASQGGDLGMRTSEQLPGELGSAVFATPEGELTGPIRSDFGFHVIRVDEIAEPGPLPLAEVRGELMSELRERETEDVYRNLTREASDALFDNADLDEIAARLDMEVQSAEGVTREDAGPFGNNQAAIDAIFDDRILNDGEVSEVVELDVNRSAIFKVVEHAPQTRKPLEEVRDDIIAEIKRFEAEAIVANRASQLMQALSEGEEFGPAAEAAGAEVTASRLVDRQSSDVDQAVLAQVFSAPKPAQGAPVYDQVQNVDGGRTVFSLEAVLPGRPESIPLADRDAGKEQLALQAGRADYVAFVQALYDEADVVINQDIVAAPDLLQ